MSEECYQIRDIDASHFPSLREIECVTFSKAARFDGDLCQDMYGELPYGLFTLPNARVRGSAGYIFHGDTPILEQNADFLRHKKFLRPRLNEVSEQAQKVIKVDVALSLISRRHNCFWHWMMDSLPKVLLAEECGFQGVYVAPPSSVAPWAKESLELVGISRERILSDTDCDFHVERLSIPTYFCGYNAHHNLSFARHFKGWIHSHSGVAMSARKRRVFVGRLPTARQRRVFNQEELFSTAHAFGFEMVFFEELSLRDQLSLSCASEAMIGGHGSGLTHALFMDEGSVVTELFPFGRRQTNDCYAKLAKIGGHRYQALESTRDCESHIEVAADRLRQALENDLSGVRMPD